VARDGELERREEVNNEETHTRAQRVVMVVDDSADIRDVLRMWLKHDYRVVEAKDGATAVRVATRERPDLILMDLHMPGMDGFSAAYHIRLLAKLGSHVPIIAISADVALGTEAKNPTMTAHDVGFTDFAPKPFSLQQLEDILTNYLPERDGEEGR
jgi:CheY-like chemotaxis protein